MGEFVSEVVIEAGRELGLSPLASGAAFGVIRGYLVQLTPTPEGVLELIRFEPSAADEKLRQALCTRRDVKNNEGTGWNYVQGVEGVLAYERTNTRLTRSRLVSDVNLLLEILEEVELSPPDPRCDCETPVEEPLSLNGFATYLCDACLRALEREVASARRAIEEWSLDWRGALRGGALACGACALTWFMVLAVTGYMHGLLAAGFGVAIGVTTRKGAGTGSLGVSLLSAGFTLAAIALGQLAFTAQELSIAGGYTSTLALVLDLPLIAFASGSDWAFALGAGLVGAWISAAFGQEREVVEVPTLSVERLLGSGTSLADDDGGPGQGPAALEESPQP